MLVPGRTNARRRARALRRGVLRPGRPPDPTTTHVGLANRCPGCGSAEVRTLCSGEDFLYRSTERSFLFVECRECRMVRLYPRPEPMRSAAITRPR